MAEELFLFFFFFKMGEKIAFLYADMNDSVQNKKLIQEIEEQLKQCP